MKYSLRHHLVVCIRQKSKMKFMRPSFQRRARRTGISFRYYWMGSFFISDEMTSQNKREALSSDFFVWPNQVNLAEIILDFYLKYILLYCNFQNASGIGDKFLYGPLFSENSILKNPLSRFCFPLHNT